MTALKLKTIVRDIAINNVVFLVIAVVACITYTEESSSSDSCSDDDTCSSDASQFSNSSGEDSDPVSAC